jgi:hypothetical protein
MANMEETQRVVIESRNGNGWYLSVIWGGIAWATPGESVEIALCCEGFPWEPAGDPIGYVPIGEIPEYVRKLESMPHIN